MKFFTQKKVRRMFAIAAAVFVLFPQSFVACDAETSGEAIRFHTAVVGTTAQGQNAAGFETTKGWTVALTSAHAVFGPIYFYGGEPMAHATPLERYFSGVVMACPTHAQYDYGAVLGEVLEQYVVDLLATAPTPTGEVPGVAGICHSAELHLHPPGDQQLPAGNGQEEFAKLNGYTMVIMGTATKDAQTIPFRVALDIPDEGTMRIVQNITADVTLDDTSAPSGSVVVEILLDAWFDPVDFSSLTETDGEGNYLFNDGTQAKTALLQAVRNRYSYRVKWSEQQ
ncbi:MAG: hypothetical protein JXX29_00640 [Deltaproteobacteria bacterium]|nr:hypothetical protein [Deltaproteobacteria bacterium]MBN2670144.1 hypothetical protein [Deltaproteobacteria bacterium]